jgi:hypothetical protein
MCGISSSRQTTRPPWPGWHKLKPQNHGPPASPYFTAQHSRTTDLCSHSLTQQKLTKSSESSVILHNVIITSYAPYHHPHPISSYPSFLFSMPWFSSSSLFLKIHHLQPWPWPCRAVTLAVSRWLPTAATRVRVRAACGVCGGQSCTGAGYLRVLRFPLPIIPPISPPS